MTKKQAFKNSDATYAKAFNAGEDMLLICATPETIRRGYHALLEAARDKQLSERFAQV